MFRALRHRNYRLWAAADLVSSTGTWMQVLGLNWLVLESTGSPTAVGLAILFQAVPMLVLGPWSGALADRLPLRPLVLATQTLHLLLAATLALIAMAGASTTAIYAIAVLTGLVAAFDGPPMGRLAAQVVGRADLGNALALGSVVNSAGRILGMSLGGALAALGGATVLFGVNAVSFLAVIIAVLALRPDTLHPMDVSPPERSGMLAGFRYLRGERRLLVLFALGFVLSSVGRNYQVTMAAMSNGPLHTGAAGFGLLSTVFAVGTVGGGLLAAHWRELGLRVLLGAALVTSALQVVSGFAPGLLLFALVILPIAAGAVVIDTAMGTRVQLGSADDMRGRVLAVQSSVSAAAGALGGPLVGWLSETMGPASALEVSGVVALLATVAATAVFVRIRGARRPAWSGPITPRNTDEPAPALT
ncbi:MFS transporter [Pseudonocardia sp. DSM 110487]|uniref:MFS transporter n=1 Tax=Pseudonocardia sp. DSM 110487 TaxID=2865833 RepID=UPI001C69516D|nr:MFS transporter [Pseudonocardia sp. DSM 110487]QYN31875.1 MFS transporter [Pseudonocardia sp. DSM 110487]